MFGLNLWTRPFLPPAPGAMGMDNANGLPRGHPGLGLGTPTYLLPGLTSDKAGGASMPSPFAPGSLFMYRPDSMLHPHMLRVNVDHGLHLGPHPHADGGERGGIVSHPSLREHHSSDSGSVESYPSAFQPTKRARLAGEEAHARVPSRHSDGGKPDDHPSFYGDRAPLTIEERLGGAGGGHGRAASARVSPVSSSARSPDSLRASPRDTNDTIGGLSPGRSEPRTPGGPPRCPICGLGLTLGEIDAHYAMELDRLRVLARMERGETTAAGGRGEDHGKESDDRPVGGGLPSPPGPMSVSESRYETYLKIKNNRHVRLCAKTRARRKRPSDTPPHECEGRGDGADHFQHHSPHHPAYNHHHHHHHHHHQQQQLIIDAENHLQQSVVTSLQSPDPRPTPPLLEPVVQTPRTSLSYQPTVSLSPVVTASDTSPTGGPSPAQAHAQAQAQAQAQAHAQAQAQAQAQAPVESDDDDDEFIRVDSPRPESVIVNVCSVEPTPTTPTPSGHQLTRSPSPRLPSPRLTLSGSHLGGQPVSIKCQVCQGAYTRPVTSVTCWHVHCEDCWLKTLGNKRLCPQCKAITSPSDLRKVYI